MPRVSELRKGDRIVAPWDVKVTGTVEANTKARGARIEWHDASGSSLLAPDTEVTRLSTATQRPPVYVGQEVTVTTPSGAPAEVVVLDIDNEAGLFLAESENADAHWVALSRIVQEG